MSDVISYAEEPIHKFLEKLSSDFPTLPGGGTALGLLGALAASLGVFVLKVSTKRVAKISLEQKRRYEELIRKFESFRIRCQRLMDLDAEAYKKVMEAFKVQNTSAKGASKRQIAIQDAFKEATLVPSELMKFSVDMLVYYNESLENIHKPLVADAGVAVEIARACFQSALWIARANLGEMEDDEFVLKELEKYELLRKKVASLYAELERKLSEQIYWEK